MRQFLVDAFASRPFTGNPACVVEPFDVWPDAAWMQTLAMENNQAETAFLLKTKDPARFGLRWFTPVLEVPLCGHATLASAHVLFREIGVQVPVLTFDTMSGPLMVRAPDKGYLEMNFPANNPVQIETPEGLAQALGAEIVETWVGNYAVVIVKNETVLRGLKPNLAEIERICTKDMIRERGSLVVSAFADPDADYEVVSRFFAPGSGIDEDPVTGSAHCIITPLFCDKLGKSVIDCFQAYPGRGGALTCEVIGDRVLLRGSAVTVLDGQLRV
ncbi:PhzF family phenazine biosynthesis protein [Candidatus Phycosocius spiralis]|uniref:Isomerase n=1 Tax=Candidatus Phycosocius spiralis TaxID=2815099 RepID=A0ABQ4PVW6_9PROT|nr:PhzF family phenazine biosynthesis protein [Candidatus Phycosocius spiralis]GIU67085.1 isomerase [Candidatus Phycosocius spiralis]